MGFWSDLFSGNLSAAETDIATAISGLPDWLKNLITTMETDAGLLLSSAAQQEAQSVIQNGLSTTAFKDSAKTIASNLEAQGVSMDTQIIYSALNGAVAALAPTPAAAPAVPVEPPPAA